jgi:hypothetical protein
VRRLYLPVIAAALLFAAVVRFGALGRDPLDPAEAGQSIAAWWTVKPPGEPLSRLAPRPESALLLGLDAAAFWLMDTATDLTARWVPAAAGVTLVLLASVLLRAETGVVSLPIVVLLALDPWLVAASRRASGAILGAGAAIVCWLLLRRLESAAPAAAVADAARRQWMLWSACVGFLLVSGTAAWDFLPPILVAALITLRGARLLGSPRPSASAMLAAAAVTAVVGATSGLLQWRGPALLSSSLESWLGSWNGAWREMSLVSIARASGGVLLYQIVLAALAAWGLWSAWSRGSRRSSEGASREQAKALALWLGWGAAMQLRADGGPDGWLAIEAPMLLAAALAISDWIGRLEHGTWGRTPRLAFGAGVVLALAAALAGTGDVPRPAPALPPARRIGGDVLALLARPAAERPRVDVVAGSDIDATLAWYLRGVPLRWIPSEGEPFDGAFRVLLVSTTLPSDRAEQPSSAPRYAVSAVGDRLHVVELR